MTKFFMFLTLFLFLAPASKADIFVWKDAETGIMASFPDTWDIDLNQDPDTVLRISGPDKKVLPLCRLRVRDDPRFKMYPVQFEADIQAIEYNKYFWQDYLLEQYDDVEFAASFGRSGLGRSHASHALFNFTGTPMAGNNFRQGIGFVSHYFDQVYIAECTARGPDYENWVPHFMNFFKSIDFDKVYNEYLPGNYRDFIHKKATEE